MSPNFDYKETKKKERKSKGESSAKFDYFIIKQWEPQGHSIQRTKNQNVTVQVVENGLKLGK